MATFTEGAILNVPVARAWELLGDPAVLAAAIPGCDQLEVTGPGTGRFTVTPALAAVCGTYSGEFTVTGQAQAGSLTLSASGAGERGGFTIDLTMRLTAASDLAGPGAEATFVRYDLGTVFSGGIARVGQRLVASITSRYATEFFAAIDEAAEAGPRPRSPSRHTGPSCPRSSYERPKPRMMSHPTGSASSAGPTSGWRSRSAS